MMADQLSRVFAALADPTRRDMVARLTVADATVGELAAPTTSAPRPSPSTSRCSRVPAWSPAAVRRRPARSTWRPRCWT
ncbi:ArsR/SmtB family transcription factor [Klenkia terrae]|uniref:ArsR/SmtB family transcription factor n=1 Tax=Klenkia terrae TaxID=1052259 RepID=UPI003613D98A